MRHLEEAGRRHLLGEVLQTVHLQDKGNLLWEDDDLSQGHPEQFVFRSGEHKSQLFCHCLLHVLIIYFMTSREKESFLTSQKAQ